MLIVCRAAATAGPELKAYVDKLGWTLDEATAVVSIPPNPDHQLETTVVQENIQLPRASLFCPLSLYFTG